MTADDVVYLVEAMVPAGSCDRMLLLAELRRRLDAWRSANPEAWAALARVSGREWVRLVERLHDQSGGIRVAAELLQAAQPRGRAA